MRFRLVLLYFALGAYALPTNPDGGGGGIKFRSSGVKAVRPRIHGRSKMNCDNMRKLAEGINLNVIVQHQKLEELARVKAAVSGGGGGFAVAKSALLDKIDTGRQIRESNQKIPGAPANVVQGLLTVAMAQKQEKDLAQCLEGTAADLTPIGTLQTLFEGGIEQHKQNANEALGACQGK